MDMNTTISERIQALIDAFCNGKNSQFAKAIGVAESNIRSYLSGTQPKFDVLSNIAIRFAINCEWLLTGSGKMLKEDAVSIPHDLVRAAPTQGESHIPPKVPMEAPPQPQPEAIPLADAKGTGLTNPIPLVTATAAAGFGNGHFSIAEEDVKEYYVIPKFRFCKVDFMIEVSGLSMYPHFNPGDVIACTILTDRKFLQWNKCHVIATREQGILVKRLMPSNQDGCLTAVSDNKEYPPFDIPLDEITGIALVVGSVSLE